MILTSVFQQDVKAYFIQFVRINIVFVGVIYWGIISLCLRRFYHLKKWYVGGPLEDDLEEQ